MTTAIIETDGAGNVTGAWVATEADGSPDVAFTTEVGQLMAERALGEAAEAIERDGTTWAEFMQHLADRQNHLTVLRYLGDSKLTAPELLAAALAAEAAGQPLLDLVA